MYGSYSNVVLTITPDDIIVQRIRELHVQPVDDDFSSYLSDEQNGWGLTLRDPYGDRVNWTYAKDLQTCGLPGPTGAYLCALPPETPVALFWC